MMTDDENLTLWIAAFRYYCGRMTYAVGDFCELLRKSWPTLPEQTRTLIRNELEHEFSKDDAQRAGSRKDFIWSYVLGHDCDRLEWEKVREIWKKSDDFNGQKT